ncbi:MAG: CHAD domain-containing protein, partial [Chloroflexi bacterium]|nr:CHAD domain-containing protein [Chloroflexota bacterium]
MDPEPRLTAVERATVERIATQAEPRYARRAIILLAHDEGVSRGETARRAGVTTRTVRHWLAAARSSNQGAAGIFAPAIWEAYAGPAPAPAPEPPAAPHLLTIAELCQQYQVDMDHARRVAELAGQLFDLTDDVHDLAPEQRNLVYTAGLLHNVGLATDPIAHHKAGRDILLRHPLADLTDEEREMVACVARFHRKKVKPDQEPAFMVLSEQAQEDTLAITALVRMADGLDYSQSQTTQLDEPIGFDEGFTIPVQGPHSQEDAGRAQKKADLWHQIFDFQLRFLSPDEPLNHLTVSELAILSASAPAPATPGVRPDDPMSEAGRKILRFHLQRMLQHEPGTRQGDDIEELHDMRVATRRMRAAARIFGDYYDPTVFAPLVKGMRRTGRALGRVRDLDVLLDKTQTYISALAPERRHSLDPLTSSWQVQRELARQHMQRYLDSHRYDRFVRALGEFVATDGFGIASPTDVPGPAPTQVCQLVPVVVYQRLAAIRAYEPLLPQADIPTLHALRIAFKRLRYTLEFFQEVLGPETTE